jgi:hypothetical protein
MRRVHDFFIVVFVLKNTRQHDQQSYGYGGIREGIPTHLSGF